MTINILRHGETLSNAQRRYAGTTDVSLSPEGRSRALAGRITRGLEQVYVTPLKRTKETAAILFPDAAQVIVPGLSEMDFGVFEGRTYEELDADPVFQAWNADGGMHPCPGGEGRSGFALRVSGALRALIKEACGRGEESLNIVAHGGTIMALMAAHALPRQSYDKWWVENLEGYALEIAPEDWEKTLRFGAVEKLDFSK